MDPRFSDKILICVDCSEEFVFTVSAQEYFAEKGFTEDPKRCKSCYMDLKRIKRHVDRDVVHRETPAPEFAEENFNLADQGVVDGNGNGDKHPDLK